jgi:hypothetical protein
MLRRSIVASLIGVALLVVLMAAFTSCGSEQQARRGGASGGGTVAKLMKARDLSEADVRVLHGVLLRLAPRDGRIPPGRAGGRHGRGGRTRRTSGTGHTLTPVS